MGGVPDFKRLLRNSAGALMGCTVLVCVCYFFVDRPVAYYVYHHGLADYSILKWLTYLPPVLQSWTPGVLIALAVRRSFGPFRRWEVAIAAACVAIIVADQFRETLSYVFGRYWPDTWIDGNPSLIRDDAYGFHPFHEGSAYESFPSGHAARTLAGVAVYWVCYPRYRWACVSVSVAIAAGLLGMNYHFVGDVIAGSVLGGIVGAYVAYWCGLGSRTARPSNLDSD